jgi:hypothetical protein
MKPTTLVRCGGVIAALLAAPVARGLAQGDSARAGRPVPTALAAAGEHGENLYDAAKAKAWRTAGRRLKALEADVALLDTQPDANRLQDEVDSLRQSVARRERQATMVHANQVTRIVAEMTEPYAPKVPVEVTRLDYYGRELEIGSETGETPRLVSAVQGIRHEWDAVRQAVSARDSLVARKFDALVTRIERARSSAEYRRPAAEELAEVDDLEHVFER